MKQEWGDFFFVIFLQRTRIFLVYKNVFFSNVYDYFLTFSRLEFLSFLCRYFSSGKKKNFTKKQKKSEIKIDNCDLNNFSFLAKEIFNEKTCLLVSGVG